MFKIHTLSNAIKLDVDDQFGYKQIANESGEHPDGVFVPVMGSDMQEVEEESPELVESTKLTVLGFIGTRGPNIYSTSHVVASIDANGEYWITADVYEVAFC